MKNNQKNQPFAHADKLTIFGLLFGAVGILILFFSIEFPVPVPIGTIWLVLVAGLLIWNQSQWTRLLAAIAGPLTLIVAVIASDLFIPAFFDTTNLFGMIGAWIQIIGVLIATVFGLVSMRQKRVDRK